MIPGQTDGEPRSYPHLALHLNRALHLLDGVPDNRKSQTGPTDVPRAGFVHTVEALEDSGKVFLRDADAGIGDDNFHIAIGAEASFEMDLARRLIEFNGIVQ